MTKSNPTTKRSPADCRLVLYVDRDTAAAIQRVRTVNQRDGLTASVSQVIRVAVRQYLTGRDAA
jgi:hypothetical protein